MLRSRPTPKAALVKIPYASNEALNRLLLPSPGFASDSTNVPSTNVPDKIVKTDQPETFESSGAYATMTSISRKEGSEASRPYPLRTDGKSGWVIITGEKETGSSYNPTANQPPSVAAATPNNFVPASEKPKQLTELERAAYAWHQQGANSVRKLASALGVSRYRAEGLAAQLKLFDPEPSGSEAE